MFAVGSAATHTSNIQSYNESLEFLTAYSVGIFPRWTESIPKEKCWKLGSLGQEAKESFIY